MTNTIEALDYEILESQIPGENHFNVWTPDRTGGIIGIGKTREDAAKNAIDCLGMTIMKIANEYP